MNRAFQIFSQEPGNVVKEVDFDSLVRLIFALRLFCEKHGIEFEDADTQSFHAQIESDTGFRWIEPRLHGRGPATAIRKMGTSQLFGVLRSIWNTSVPPRFRVGTSKIYEKGSLNTDIHNPKYMAEAFEEMMEELSARTDMTAQEIVWFMKLQTIARTGFGEHFIQGAKLVLPDKGL